MYRGPRPHRGSYPPAAFRGFAPHGPPPADSIPGAPYRNEHARDSNDYPHSYRRHMDHPRRRYSSPGRGSAEDYRGEPPLSKDYGHQTSSSPHDNLSIDRGLLITVDNELTKNLSQSTGAGTPHDRDYSSQCSRYEGHDEHRSRRHSSSHCKNRGRSHSPDEIDSRSHPSSGNHSDAMSHSRVLSQGRSRPRSSSRSRTRNRGGSRARSKSRQRSRSRERSWSRGRSHYDSSRNNKRNEDLRELERAHQHEKLQNMMPTNSILKNRIDSSQTNPPKVGLSTDSPLENSGSDLLKNAEALLCTMTKKMDPHVLASVLAQSSNENTLQEVIRKLQLIKESGPGFSLPHQINSQENSDLTQLLSLMMEETDQPSDQRKNFAAIEDEMFLYGRGKEDKFPVMRKPEQRTDVYVKTGRDVLYHEPKTGVVHSLHQKEIGNCFSQRDPGEDGSQVIKQRKYQDKHKFLASPRQEPRFKPMVTWCHDDQARTDVEEYEKMQELLKMRKNLSEAKDQSYSALPSQISQSSYLDRGHDSISKISSTEFPASKLKSSLATQMERFIGALNKADLSSLLREARKNSDPLENHRIPQQVERKMSCREKFYESFQETDCSENTLPFLERKEYMSHVLGRTETNLDDRLPHERAVVDGSGFSKIVGMNYGAEAKPQNRFLYEEEISSNSQSRLSDAHKNVLQQYDKLKVSQDSNSGKLYFDSSTEDEKKYERQKFSENYRVEGSLSHVHQNPEEDNEDVDQKINHNKAIQNLLQTIGLNLDTAEVSKLTDRTKERLYGKKVKPQPLESLDKKNKHSISGYDRKRSSHSSDSEDVDSVSSAKTSNREVYMSYLDSIKYRHNAGAFEEQDLFSLKRTIKNSPEAKQMSPNPYEIASGGVPDESDKPKDETSSADQSVGLLYTEFSSEFSTAQLDNKHDSWGGSFVTDEKQNSCGSISVMPLHYNTGYSTPPVHFPFGYGTCTTASSMMPPSPSQFFPAHSTFNSPGPYAPPFPYPFTSAQFGFNLQPSISGYTTQQVKARSTARNRCLKTIKTVQTQKSESITSPVAKEVPTVMKRKTKKDTRIEAEAQMRSMMEDDIKAKQKKRLEQFNQRMRQKKAQQMESQQTRGQNQNQNPAPGKALQTEVKNVWICGHSLVFWAEKRATSPEIGMQLGMDPKSVRIWWKGVQGMIWEQLLPQLLQLKDNWPKPDVILIHLGGNDIGKMTPKSFVLTVKKDLISMKSIFPQCHLVWSDILPRMSWRHSDDSTAVNNMRQAINNTIRGIIAELGGSSLTHDNIVPELDNGLYRPDGVHLSGKGIDTFNLNMQDFLEKWESETSETETSSTS